MSKYIPYPFYHDDVPVDISYVFEAEKPAGKHGFLTAAPEGFVFQDGAPGRFWGTNFNGGANFPDHAYSEMVAKRLAKIGVNLVRFHQLDAEWDTPNIFQFTKGRRCADTLSFDPESMDRLDYLIHCLKKEGVYCYLDLLTYRKYKSGDGVENALLLDDSAKPYGNFDRGLIALQKKLAFDLWNHVNPYTGLAYKEEPAIVLCEVTNEDDLVSYPIEVEPYASRFRDMLAAWVAENGYDYDAGSCDLNGTDEVLLRFKVYIMENYYREMIGYMRSIGVKIPLTGTNWTKNGATNRAQIGCDYTDSHSYFFYDWQWRADTKRCTNDAMSRRPESGFDILSAYRVFDKPFFVSEWDLPWPSEFRAESPLLCAAVGSFQNWGGFAIHTYSYGTRLSDMRMLGKEGSSSTIGNIAYREGIFSTWNDPAKFGLFYHSALITRRQDVAPALGKKAVRVERLHGKTGKAFAAASEYTGLAACYEDGVTDVREDDAWLDLSAGEVRSDTGELYRSWKKQYGAIDTPRTQCAYGSLQQNGKLELSGLTVDCKTDFAVVALSSLTDAPIEKSDSLLLTTVGRAKNTDARFDGEVMLDYGRPPVLVEVIEATLSLRTERTDLRVVSVNAEGFYVGTVPSAWENGTLTFSLGEQFPSMYYLILAE